MKHQKPTEPCYQWYLTPYRRKKMLEITWEFDVHPENGYLVTFFDGRKHLVDEMQGAWGPRIPEWRHDETGPVGVNGQRDPENPCEHFEMGNPGGEMGNGKNQC